MTERGSEDVLAPSLDWWEAWLKESGEQPPDFASLPSRGFLPSLLEHDDGSRIETVDAWNRQRRDLWEQLCHYHFGKLPTAPPRLSTADVEVEEKTYNTVRRRVQLTFDANGTDVTFNIDVILPAEAPQEPLPVFMTQTTHRSWAALAVSRGYASCIYPAADDDDQSLRFNDAYPDCDWATIPRRAWLAGRALDYLLTLPEVDGDMVAITGHSRNGKQSLAAAAMDPRISAVISSSSGSGGSCPYRLMSEAHLQESVEFMTRRFPDWFHPRLRFFTGREDQLPVDIHALVALIAPRPVLLSTALQDNVETTFAIEQTYLAAREVYGLYGAPEKINIRWRDGDHGTAAEDIHSYMDWCDWVFKRGPSPLPARPRLVSSFDPAAWEESQSFRRGTADVPAPLAWPAEADDVRQAVRWSLGKRPPLRREYGSSYGSEKPYLAQLLGRDSTPEGVAKTKLQFSEYISGDLYHPEDPQGPLPVVIWLHPHSRPRGYRGAYMLGAPIYHVLAQAGFAVFAFDQLGYGRRIEEGGAFYQRYPNWSKLDRMVRDVEGALDVMEGAAGHVSVTVLSSRRLELPPLDPDNVYCLGYGMGAWVALYATALEPRLAGLAAFCDLTPFRTAEPRSEQDALYRLGRWHGLAPRLGPLSRRPERAPYDLEHLLALVAPRPALVVSPTHDRFSDVEAVKGAVERAQTAYGDSAGTTLQLQTPHDYHRFQPEQHDTALSWLRRVAGLNEQHQEADL